MHFDSKRKMEMNLVGNNIKQPTKLRKVEAFDDEDDLVSGIPSAVASTVGNINVLSKEQQDIIIKTAAWLASNPDKAAPLIEKSRENSALSFLIDKKSPGGLFFAKEMNRIETEKEVQNICTGTDILPYKIAQPTPALGSLSRPPPPPLPLPLQLQHSGSNASSSRSDETSVTVTTSAGTQPQQKRNRWGPPLEDVKETVVPTTSVSAPSLSMNAATSLSEVKAQYEFDDYDTNGTDSRMATLIQEQKELQLLEARIREAARQSMVGSSSRNSCVASVTVTTTSNGDKGDPSGASKLRTFKQLPASDRESQLYNEQLKHYQELAALYDDTFRDTVEDAEANNGVIDGGTWEHRKRAQEMLKTAEKNLELTLLNSKKHHMSDFMPQHVLQSFVKKAEAIKAGNTYSESAHIDAHKLDESNIGFNLLKKSGWSEGTGLGSTGSGIVQPIAAAAGAATFSRTSSTVVDSGSSHSCSTATAYGAVAGSGIGVKATHEIEASDDQFDTYRKRMMLAYRFRPNPLNNPRRDYY